MKLHADCLACFARGTLDTAKLATCNEKFHFEIMQKIFKILADCKLDVPPPLMALAIQKAVTQVTGCTDPYRAIKKNIMIFALIFIPNLHRKLKIRILKPQFAFVLPEI